MDSGNSGSLQSSSCGDEEYDSRATTISPFMSNSTAHAHVSPISQPQITTQTAMFDPLSNYLQVQQNPNSLFNPNMIWSKTLRSDQNIINPILSSSPFVDSFNTVQLPTLPAAVSGPSDHNHNHNNQSARNPKKRSRGSRRAPTTVLTTDTTNFRAMVQEFTGIPAPPFSSSPFQRSRIDFFGTPTSAVRSSSLGAAEPQYLLRPFPHKVHQPPPPPPSPPFLSSASSSLLSPPRSSNLFTTLLQSTMRFPISNLNSMISSNAQDPPELVSSNDSKIKTGSFDKFVGSPRTGDHVQLISGNYYNLSTNSMNGKANNWRSANPSSNFHCEKEPESVATSRGEGMVESWLCSSSD